MILIEKTLFGERDKVQIAIDRLKLYEPPEGYYLAFSGGKDSIIIKRLADMAGVKYDAHYSLPTIDPPEIIYFIREQHPDVHIDRPLESFLKVMIRKGFPDRHRRWCCALFKERGGDGRLVVTGIRWEESSNRAKRKMVETCYKNPSKRYLNVIIDWTKADVWQFIKDENLPYCKLYDEGWDRIGCLFCPMASGWKRKLEIERYPKIAANFRKAFIKLYDNKKQKGISVNRWADGEEMFQWWLQDHRKKKDPDQQVIFE